MLARLISFSLHHSALVLVGAGLLLAVTAWQLPRMPIDVFPELNAPTVVIIGEAGGLAAEEVEQYVTFPIETTVNGLPGVRRVRSASSLGLALVWIEFDWGTDIYRARQLVAERLATVREALPPATHVELTPITSITGEIMLLALSSPDGSHTGLELRAHAEYELRNRLLAVPGVAQVIPIGGELPEYQVHVRQDELLLYGLTLADVANGARAAHSTASAGYLASVQGRELALRQSSQIQSVGDIRATVLDAHDGGSVEVGNIADVQLGGAPRRGTAADSGRPAVVLSVQKSPGANTLALTRAVDAAVVAAEARLPAGMKLNRAVFRQADFIERSVNNVIAVLRDATIIVAVVLLLFLLNVRTTVITLLALPISLAAALLALHALGLSVNVMTLGGLAVAVGVLVDDAIIDVENVFRRLQENAQRTTSERRPPLAVILEASNEIRPAMVLATLIIVIVFVPLLFLEGLEGRFFAPLAMTYIVSVLTSLVVALTVTPALCKLLLGGRSHVNSEATSAHSGEGAGFLVGWLKRRYRPTLVRALARRKLILGGAAAVTGLALCLGATFGSSFLPEFNEGTFTVFLLAPPGTSLVESDRLAFGVESRLIATAGVRSVTRRTGRAERDEHAEPVSSSEIEVTVEPGYSKEAVRRSIDAILEDVPGVTTMVGQPIEHRLSHILSGTPAAIAINVFGDDLHGLRQIARRVEVELKATPGARDVAAHREVMVESLPIRYRAQDLAAAGLTPALAAEQVQRAFAGEVVARVNQGPRQLDVVVRLAADERESIEDVRRVVLRGMDGALVRLSDVAEVEPELTSSLIAREGARRKAVVSCNVAEGYNLGDLVQAVRGRVDPIVQGAGFSVVYGGQFEAQQSATRTIGLLGTGVLVVMLLLLQLSTGSLRASLLVLLNLPLAIIGGIAAIYVTESPDLVIGTLALFGLGGARYVPPVISIASLVGFITLFGIAVRNGVLLVNHYAYLRDHEGRSLEEAIVRGSLERLSPILMTALCAALGLAPLALAAGEPGSELLAPLAIVVLGGLISSTFLNLIVVPAGYALLFGAAYGSGLASSAPKGLAGLTGPGNEEGVKS
ncbi:MAG: efflux RND transporter permease subunit [Planctomycetota bacterium]